MKINTEFIHYDYKKLPYALLLYIRFKSIFLILIFILINNYLFSFIKSIFGFINSF